MKELQDYINQLFGITSSVSAPIIISVAVFVSGFLLTEFVKAYSAFNKRKAVRSMFKLNLIDVKDAIMKQSKGYSALADQLVFKDSNNYNIAIANFHQISAINQIGYESTFNAFFTGFENVILKFFQREKRIIAFHKIWEIIEFTTLWHKKSVEDLDKFMSTFNTINQKRNQAIGEYLEFIEPILLSGASNPEYIKSLQNPEAIAYYLNEIDKIHVRHQKTPGMNNPFKSHRKLILPVRLLNQRFDDVQIVYKTNKPLLQATFSYTDLRNLLNVYKSIFEEYAKQFQIHSNRISDATNILISEAFTPRKIIEILKLFVS